MRWRRWMLGSAALLALACLDGPTPGEVTLVLQTPNQNDGAISFVIQTSAPGEIVGVTATCDSCLAFPVRITATEMRGIITGNVDAGPIARVSVLNGAPNQAYSVHVLEAANRQFAPQTDSTGYTLSIHR